MARGLQPVLPLTWDIIGLASAMEPKSNLPFLTEDVRMRKEIKRAMLRWPLAASATITVASLFHAALPAVKQHANQLLQQKQSLVASLDRWQNQSGESMESIWDSTSDQNNDRADSSSPSRPIAFSDSLAHSSLDANPPARWSGGIDGVMKHDHQSRDQILAPVRDESHELAGLPVTVRCVAAPQRIAADLDPANLSLERLLSRLWDADTMDLTGKTRRGRHFAGSSPIGALSLATLGGQDPIPDQSPTQDRIASLRRTTSPAETTIANQESTAPASVVDEGVLELLPSKSSLPESTRVLGKPSTSVIAESSANDHSDWPAGWPATPKLEQQLATLATLGQASDDADLSNRVIDWIDQIQDQQTRLRSLNRIGADESGPAINALSKLADEGIVFGESIDDRDLQVAMLQAAHAINRRVAVWKPVWQNTRGDHSNWIVGDLNPENTTSIDRVEDALDAVVQELGNTGDLQGWSDFLLIDELTDAISDRRGNVESRSIVAQRVLSRLDWHALDGEHTRWLRRDSVMNLAAAIRPWTHAVVDYSELLRQIERQESDAIDLASIDIASAVQSLRYSENSNASDVANSLNLHYRNANVRFAITSSMLNRVLPAVDPKTVPVHTTVLGTKVRGTSKIQSDLKVDLQPATDRWSLKFQTLGNVETQTTGRSGPVSVLTSGANRFVAAAPIEVTRDGVDLGDVKVDVRGRTKLRGIRSEYDGWPLVGALVRSFASSKYDSMKPHSNRIASGKLRQQVAAEMDQQLDQKVDAATDQLSKMVLGPLGKMKLDPQVIDMQTTPSRLLARYRLAGDWQLAAFTPRPRAPRTSLMSVQAHQSAINNTLEQLVPRDEPMLIDDVIVQAADMFGQTIDIPEDVPGDVTIQFARTRPITVEIEENRLWVTLRIVKLRRGDAIPLTNFIVRAAYRPDASGLEAYLVREGHLRISGPGMSMRERLPARAVFNKVLSPNRKLPMTMPSLVQHPSMQGLAISQFELRDGWIGIAVSEAQAPRIALKP